MLSVDSWLNLFMVLKPRLMSFLLWLSGGWLLDLWFVVFGLVQSAEPV